MRLQGHRGNRNWTELSDAPRPENLPPSQFAIRVGEAMLLLEKGKHPEEVKQIHGGIVLKYARERLITRPVTINGTGREVSPREL